jgi:hypothetical protein
LIGIAPLKPGDLLALLSRISRPALAAGVMIATTVYFVLTGLGVKLDRMLYFNCGEDEG